MQAADVMTRDVVTVAPDASVGTVAELLVEHRISAVPVIDAEGRVLGVVSEGDLMRRLEDDADRRGSWWLRLFGSNSANAADFVKAHGRRAQHVMTQDVVTVTEETPVAEVARLLETRRIKRVPVVRDGRLVGIVSRANLLHGLASLPTAAGTEASADDRTLREQALQAINGVRGLAMSWINVTVRDGVAELWGTAPTDDEERAAQVAVENVPGVRRVVSHLGRLPGWTYGV